MVNPDLRERIGGDGGDAIGDGRIDRTGNHLVGLGVDDGVAIVAGTVIGVAASHGDGANLTAVAGDALADFDDRTGNAQFWQDSA